ncbi:CTLH domain-containing protein [Favolaschia claudopus]|uniref:CTLH domain-containing protein n=1 Tax=Favolaschia claudopus TaxID=2862362 RepID=A0AAW0BSI3_9AGAR
MQYGVGLSTDFADLNADIEQQHEALLELISSQSDEDSGSIHRSFLNASSNSFVMLPPSPKIFHGREAELKTLLTTLLAPSEPAHVAILGPGGMGKTALALATVHHPDVMAKYPERHFVSCESATSYAELLVSLGLHLGPEPSWQSPKAILNYFGACGPCLLVLDNFETPWEASESRSEVEEFIGQLSGIPTLALLLTMRGVERPGKVKWSRPFLSPLDPLSSTASRQIFLDIADEPDDGEDAALDDLLDLSDRLPLAIALMANIASFEGYLATLSRWQVENTALLSDGHDKRSNLEKSITLSLNSPRLASSPNAINLLALISLLPDGIRVEDLIASMVPIPDVRQAQWRLVGTSLAYVDVSGRLKALSPIREYIRRTHAPAPQFTTPLRTYFQNLLALWKAKRHIHSGNLGPELASYVGNITELLRYGLFAEQESSWVEIGDSILVLHDFSRTMLKGDTQLINKLPELINDTGDSGLRWRYATRCLRPGPLLPTDPDALVEEGVSYYGTHMTRSNIDDVIAFYDCVARHYSNGLHKDLSRATEYNALTLDLARDHGGTVHQLKALATKCYIAQTSDAPRRLIPVAREGRKLGGLASNPEAWEFYWTEAWALSCIGDFRGAQDLCVEAHEWLVSAGLETTDRRLFLLDVEADVHLQKGEYSEARAVYAEMLKRTSPQRSPIYHGYLLTSAARVDMIIGNVSMNDVSAKLEAAQAVYTAYRIHNLPITVCAKAEFALYRDDVITGRSLLLDCLAENRTLFPLVASDCLAILGDPRNGVQSSTADVLPWSIIFLAFVRKMQDPIRTLHALRRIADSTTIVGEDTALVLFRVVSDVSAEMGIHHLQAECMLGIGDILNQRGDVDEARKMWEGARSRFVRSSRSRDVLQVDARLS